MIHRELIIRYVGYNAVGLICTAIYLALNIFLVSFLHLDPMASVVIGFIIYVALNYLLNSFWVFKKQMQTTNHRHASRRFIIVSLVGLLLNTSIMYLTVHILKIWYFYGLIIATAIIPTVNFVLHSLWSFRSTHSSLSQEKL